MLGIVPENLALLTYVCFERGGSFFGVAKKHFFISTSFTRTIFYRETSSGFIERNLNSESTVYAMMYCHLNLSPALQC